MIVPESFFLPGPYQVLDAKKPEKARVAGQICADNQNGTAALCLFYVHLLGRLCGKNGLLDHQKANLKSFLMDPVIPPQILYLWVVAMVNAGCKHLQSTYRDPDIETLVRRAGIAEAEARFKWVHRERT